jgi:hypothetical protein
VTEQRAQAVLDYAETALARYRQLGFPAPLGSSRYLINIYIEPTKSFDSANYARRDAQGYPYFVIREWALPTDAEWTEQHLGELVAHELFHTVQFSVTAFDSDNWATMQLQWWYWEATAEWGAAQIYPAHIAIDRLPAYTLYPYFALRTRLSDFAWQENPDLLIFERIYAAGIFPYYLTNVAGATDVVRASWIDGTREEDPLEVLATLLDRRGIDMRRAFAEFAARTAVLDYPDRAEMQARERKAIDNGLEQGWFRSPITAQVSGTTKGRVSMSDWYVPEAYAYKSSSSRSSIHRSNSRC